MFYWKPKGDSQVWYIEPKHSLKSVELHLLPLCLEVFQQVSDTEEVTQAIPSAVGGREK